MPRASKTALQFADPTIAEVLDRFLVEQRDRLSKRTFRSYEDVIGLLRHSLDRYAHTRLDREEAKLFEELHAAEESAHREFCEIFGPEHILPNLDEFLHYFMPRKVMAGKGLLRAAGTVTKKLAKWLAQNGYAQAEEAEIAMEGAAEAARDLPAADDLLTLLVQITDMYDRHEGDLEDSFVITRVDPPEIWLHGFVEGCDVGAIVLPPWITERCRRGWEICGAAGMRDGEWCLVDVWNVVA